MKKHHWLYFIFYFLKSLQEHCYACHLSKKKQVQDLTCLILHKRDRTQTLKKRSVLGEKDNSGPPQAIFLVKTSAFIFPAELPPVTFVALFYEHAP